MNIRISRTSILCLYILLVSADLFLVVITALRDLGVSAVNGGVLHQFDLRAEGTAGVWYSSSLLLLTGIAAALIANMLPGGGHSNRLYRLGWYGAASVFVLLSVDETAQLHERAGRAFTAWAGQIQGLTDETSNPTFGWLVLFLPAIVLFVAGMIALARWWLVVTPRSRTLAIAAVSCWVGVLLAEVAEAQLRRWSMSRSGQGAIEEGLELAGSTLFLMSFLEYLAATGIAAPAEKRSFKSGQALHS